MSLIHLLITAAGLSAFAGSAWSVDQAVDRHARIPDAAAAPADPAEAVREEDEDPRLLY